MVKSLNCESAKKSAKESANIPLFFIDKGTYKEIIRDDKLLFLCPFCNSWFRALAHHTTQKHKITARKLRKMFNLKYNYQLITPDLKERHKEIVFENKESHIKINLLEKGNKTRYIKGDFGHLKTNWSNQSIALLRERGKKQFENLIRRNKTAWSKESMQQLEPMKRTR